MALIDVYGIKEKMFKLFSEDELLKADKLDGKDATIDIDTPLEMVGSVRPPWVGIYFVEWEIVGQTLTGANIVSGKPYIYDLIGEVWVVEHATDVKKMVQKRDRLLANTWEVMKKNLTIDSTVRMTKFTGGSFDNLINDSGNFVLGASINFALQVRG
jgi:hypothetical protein